MEEDSNDNYVMEVSQQHYSDGGEYYQEDDEPIPEEEDDLIDDGYQNLYDYDDELNDESDNKENAD